MYSSGHVLMTISLSINNSFGHVLMTISLCINNSLGHVLMTIRYVLIHLFWSCINEDFVMY